MDRSVGGVFALAFSRELSPVVTSIVVTERIGSAYAAELGTMQVSEQTDMLRVLGTNPVDYLIAPRVIACCVALPILTLMCFTISMASSALLADGVYGVSINITTMGGAKGVGESTTSAVVISLVGIFIANFALSCLFFQGAGASLRNCA